MNTNLNPVTAANNDAKDKLTVKIFGVGSAGINMLGALSAESMPGAKFVAVNAETQTVGTAVSEKIFLEPKLLRGLGTGGDPERGRSAAEEFFPTLKEACANANAVFIIAGLGGGAGTGISPVLARAAKEAGALVLAFVTMPFECEGNRRQRQAKKGLEELKAAADGVICLPNQKILKLVDENSSVVETFKASNSFLADGVNGVWRLMARKGLIEIHFADLCALLRGQRGESCFATAEGVGQTRSREALDKLFAHPMLDNGKVLADSEAVLVSLTSGVNLTMAEVNRVMEHINGKCSKAQVILGAAIDESFNDRLAITLVVSRRSAPVKRSVAEEAPDEAAQINEQLLDEESTPRPQSRIVPPAPEITPEKAQQIFTKTGTRGKNKPPKWRQTHLELEIVSKGRFDKSEPTIHKGEDLDVPTYIRRGISLN